MIEVYTDGASSGNPGKSGAGIYIKSNGGIFQYALPLAPMSNHEAEFHAAIKALEICQTKFPGEILSFRSDSKVLVDVIEKGFTKNKDFLPLFMKINELANEFPYFFMKWIPKKENYHADQLAKQAIRMHGHS